MESTITEEAEVASLNNSIRHVIANQSGDLNSSITLAKSSAHNSQRGHFSFYVGAGYNLPDTDGWLNDPDPYVKVTAVLANGVRQTKYTCTIGGDRNPGWYQWLDWGNLGCDWSHFEIEVWDEDGGIFNGDDDLMFRKGTFIIRRLTPIRDLACRAPAKDISHIAMTSSPMPNVAQ